MDDLTLAFPGLSLPALALLALTGLVLLLSRDWRWLILTLAFPGLSLPALALLALTGLVLLLSRDWRWLILTLALQYVGVFMVVMLVWPMEIAVVKLVAGWMSGAILGMAISSAPVAWQQEEHSSPSSRVFRLLAAALVGLAVGSLSSPLQAWLPGVSVGIILASLSLIGLGLLHLGLTSQPLRSVIGLLTVLSGFEILYAAVESSTLVAGLLAGVSIGLALVGAYLLLSPAMEREI